MIAVIDYGMGNLRSVVKAFELYTPEVRVVRSPDEVKANEALVLPGDGAFGMAMKHLQEGKWVDLIKKHIAEDKLFVGICVGYQLLFETSEEFGSHQGLGIIPGKVVRFDPESGKVPHMGWNQVAIKKDSPFLKDIDDNSYFYFIHTYHPADIDESWTAGETEYGRKFPSIVAKGNILGTQFHPEKSHKAGLKIIENIVRIACS